MTEDEEDGQIERIRICLADLTMLHHQFRISLQHALLYTQASQIYARDAARWGRMISEKQTALAELKKGIQ